MSEKLICVAFTRGSNYMLCKPLGGNFIDYKQSFDQVDFLILHKVLVSASVKILKVNRPPSLGITVYMFYQWFFHSSCICLLPQDGVSKWCQQSDTKVSINVYVKSSRLVFNNPSLSSLSGCYFISMYHTVSNVIRWSVSPQTSTLYSTMHFILCYV